MTFTARFLNTLGVLNPLLGVQASPQNPSYCKPSALLHQNPASKFSKRGRILLHKTTTVLCTNNHHIRAAPATAQSQSRRHRTDSFVCHRHLWPLGERDGQHGIRNDYWTFWRAPGAVVQTQTCIRTGLWPPVCKRCSTVHGVGVPGVQCSQSGTSSKAADLQQDGPTGLRRALSQFKWLTNSDARACISAAARQHSHHHCCCVSPLQVVRKAVANQLLPGRGVSPQGGCGGA
jgi:hypothetical protein